jgi:hypothetical protein
MKTPKRKKICFFALKRGLYRRDNTRNIMIDSLVEELERTE